MRALWLAGLAAACCLQAQPRPQRFTLPNGLQVLHLEDHEHPVVRALLHLRLEPGDTPPGRQGLPRLLLQMVQEAETADLKAGELDRILEDSGIELRATLDPGGYTWRLAARSRDQDRALGLLADRLLRTVLDPAHLGAQRLACWREEQGQEGSPHARLGRELAQDPATKPTLGTLGAITLGDLLAFRARVFSPDRAVLILHGDLGLEQAKRMMLLSLGSWKAQAVPPSAAPGAGAAAIAVATPASPRRIAAPGLGLRIQAVALEPAGLAPEVAGLLRLLVPGHPSLAPVRVTLAKGCLVATLDGVGGTSGAGAWALFLERVEGFRRRGFTQADLDHAQTAWSARRSLASLDPEAQMDLALTEALGQAVSADRMQALSLKALNEGLRTWLDPAHFRSGACGDPGDLKTLP